MGRHAAPSAKMQHPLTSARHCVTSGLPTALTTIVPCDGSVTDELPCPEIVPVVITLLLSDGFIYAAMPVPSIGAKSPSHFLLPTAIAMWVARASGNEIMGLRLAALQRHVS